MQDRFRSAEDAEDLTGQLTEGTRLIVRCVANTRQQKASWIKTMLFAPNSRKRLRSLED